MNNSYGFGRIILTIIIAMCMKIAPLPSLLAVYNPDWVLLTLIYWSLRITRTCRYFSRLDIWFTHRCIDRPAVWTVCLSLFTGDLPLLILT